MVDYFYPEYTPYKTYMVKLDHNLVPNFKHKGGTLLCVQAALLNISPANYLRLCRDEFCGVIKGKNHIYPHVEFSSEKEAKRLCSVLNPQMEKYIEYRKNL